MNMWGFHPSILGELKRRFQSFLEQEVPGNPLKSEYFLPDVVEELLKEDKATVKVLRSADRWYGVTYKEDKEVVVKAIAELKKQGIYPEEF
jgi:bifunctional N-acetylglucosamine-1-phosphate-uridyltransferase/glucosamine-1-phosphate-acetyltransferase GlmU-like protein